MKIVASSLPKSGSKTLISDFGSYFRNCLYLEAKVERGLGNLSTSKLSRRLFSILPIPTILYGHFPFSYSLERTVARSDLVLVGLRPMSDLVFSYLRHIERTGYSPLDLRVGGFPDISLGWEAKDELEKVTFVLDWLIPYAAKFLLSWIWVKNNHSSKVRFVLYEDIVKETYRSSLRESFNLGDPGSSLGFHYGRRPTNVVEKARFAPVDNKALIAVQSIIQARRLCYVSDFAGEEILFDYAFK